MARGKGRGRAAGSESAGYHYDATPKRPKRTRTPVKTPPKGSAAKAPAGDYAGAEKDFAASVAALPAPARKATEAAIAAKTRRRGSRASAGRRRRANVADLSTRGQRRRGRGTVRPRVYEPDPTKAVISSSPNPKVKQAEHLLAEIQRIQKKASPARDLPHLDDEGDRNARIVLNTGRRRGVPYKEQLAATETGLVESGGFKNLNYGDADSEGWRQERTSIYGTAEPRNVKAGAANFFDEVISDTGGSRGRGKTAGELAQTVQGSAFPERYDERKGEAVEILRAYNRGTLKPKQARKLKVLKRKAAKLGVELPGQGGAAAPRKLKGEWAGTKDILANVTKGFSITSEKRTPAENASVGGAEDSDHLTTNTNTYATDLPASGAELNQIGSTVAKRLRIKGWTPGNYNWYTSPKYPGYRFQILSEVDGHFDHVHAGAEWVGQSLPPGTVLGGVVSSGSGAVSVGGAAARAYAAATGQSVETLSKKVRSGKLSPQQIYRKLEQLGAGIGSAQKVKGGSQADGESPEQELENLRELERRYGRSAV